MINNNKHVTLSLSEDEWLSLDATAHFNNLTPEQLLLHLVHDHVIEPEKQSEAIFRTDQTKTEFESVMNNINFYLSQTIQEAQRYEDDKMVTVLTRLRDHHIHHHKVCTDLYRVYASM